MKRQNEILKKAIENKAIPFKIVGHSMVPTFYPGDTVMLESMKMNTVSPGDIIIFELDENIVIHRVVDIYEDKVITKGDHNKYLDPMINVNNIIGKVVDSPQITEICKPSFILNFWGDINNKKIKYGNLFNVNIVNLPNKLFDDGINICITPFATKRLCDIRGLIYYYDKIYLHLDVRISDHPVESFTMDSNFDFVVRSGTYFSQYDLNSDENLLILLGEMSSMI